MNIVVDRATGGELAGLKNRCRLHRAKGPKIPISDLPHKPSAKLKTGCT